MRPTVSDLVFNELRKQVGKRWERNKSAVGAITAASRRHAQSARRAFARVATVFLCSATASKSNSKKSAKLFQTYLAHMPRIPRAYLANNRKNATRRKRWTGAKRPLIFPTVTPRQNTKQVVCDRYLNAPYRLTTCTHPIDPASRPLVRSGFFMGLHRDFQIQPLAALPEPWCRRAVVNACVDVRNRGTDADAGGSNFC